MDFPFTAPLLHRDGYQIAEIEGTADIRIDRHGDWYVEGIEIEECKRVGKTLHRRMLKIERPGVTSSDTFSHIWTAIWRHVEHDCSTEIETAIYEASLQEDRPGRVMMEAAE